MDGSITALSAWRDCKVDLESEATMKALEDQPTSTARAIFDDVVDLLQKAFKADRKVNEQTVYQELESPL